MNIVNSKLNLPHNNTSDQGLSHQCAALKDEHCKLTKLNLSCNNISDQGLSHLFAALKNEHRKLTKLGVDYISCCIKKDELCQLRV